MVPVFCPEVHHQKRMEHVRLVSYCVHHLSKVMHATPCTIRSIDRDKAAAGFAECTGHSICSYSAYIGLPISIGRRENSLYLI